MGILLSSLPRWGRPYTFSVCHSTRSLSHIITHRCDNFSGFCLWRHSVRVGNLVGISDRKMRAWIENRQGLKALRMAASCQNSNKNIYQLPPSLFFKAAGDSRSIFLTFTFYCWCIWNWPFSVSHNIFHLENIFSLSVDIPGKVRASADKWKLPAILIFYIKLWKYLSPKSLSVHNVFLKYFYKITFIKQLVSIYNSIDYSDKLRGS